MPFSIHAPLDVLIVERALFLANFNRLAPACGPVCGPDSSMHDQVQTSFSQESHVE